jgi:AraC family transcriptional regulator
MVLLQSEETSMLWRGFKPKAKGIEGRKDDGFVSISVYPPNFHPALRLEKWAGVEVEAGYEIPHGMDEFIIPEGKYAVFSYKGTIQTFFKMYGYFMDTWLPENGYGLEDRPHFELLNDKYLGPLNPESEEEVWIPIKSILV